MKQLTCVIIGGGHAGIQALKVLQGTFRKKRNGLRVRFVLIDKQPAHVRKVLLFRPAVGEENICVPWSQWAADGTAFVQGTVTSVDGGDKRIRYTDAQGSEVVLNYDLLVVAVGSVLRKPDPEQGGIALCDLASASDIRDRWRANLMKAASESDPRERKRLMSVAVAGAGISGIETGAELSHAMRREAPDHGLNPDDVTVWLLNAQDRLFPEGSARAAHKLEQMLPAIGVRVLHQRKAVREEAGEVILDNDERLRAGLCVWMIGLMPSPSLRDMGLPLTEDGRVRVDECYRISGVPGAYSIGDCAAVYDPATGASDRMTCKEAGMQAIRLGKIITADLEGRPAPSHQTMMDFYCIGLGPGHGLMWARKWGLEIIMTGKLAWNMKKIAWEYASRLR